MQLIDRLSARQGLLALGWLGLAGTVAQLVLDRHWSSFWQLPPWLALIMTGFALRLAARAEDSPRRLARGLAVAVIAIAAAGIYFHIEENYQAGPLDRNYTATWESMSLASRLWIASTQAVGPSPVLASGALVMTALVAVIATRRGT